MLRICVTNWLFSHTSNIYCETDLEMLLLLLLPLPPFPRPFGDSLDLAMCRYCRCWCYPRVRWDSSHLLIEWRPAPALAVNSRNFSINTSEMRNNNKRTIVDEWFKDAEGGKNIYSARSDTEDEERDEIHEASFLVIVSRARCVKDISHDCTK